MRLPGLLLGAAVLVFGLCGSAHSQTGTLVAMSGPYAGVPMLKTTAPERGNDTEPLPALLTISRDVDEVRVEFVVTDRFGRVVTDLRSDEVAVFDDQRLIGHFESFQPHGDAPVRLGILTDVSTSEETMLPTALAGARRFLRKSLRKDDVVSVASFGQRIQMLQTSTNEVARLERALSGPAAPAYVTALYDAIVATCRDMQMENDDGARRALVLLTDGQDNASMYSWADAASESIRSGVAVFAIVLDYRAPHPRKMLEHIADLTGGAVFYATNAQQVEDAFGNINELLRTRYTLTFRAGSRSSGFHQLEVTAVKREGLKVSARAGYFTGRQH